MKSILKTPTFLIMGGMILFTLIGLIALFTGDAAAQASLNWENKTGWVVVGGILAVAGVAFLFYRQNLMVKNHNATIEEDDTWVILVATLVYLLGVAIMFGSLIAQTRY